MNAMLDGVTLSGQNDRNSNYTYLNRSIELTFILSIEVPNDISVNCTRSYATGEIVVVMIMNLVANILKASAAVAQIVVVCTPKESLHDENERKSLLTKEIKSNDDQESCSEL